IAKIELKRAEVETHKGYRLTGRLTIRTNPARADVPSPTTAPNAKTVLNKKPSLAAQVGSWRFASQLWPPKQAANRINPATKMTAAKRFIPPSYPHPAAGRHGDEKR